MLERLQRIVPVERPIPPDRALIDVLSVDLTLTRAHRVAPGVTCTHVGSLVPYRLGICPEVARARGVTDDVIVAEAEDNIKA